MCAHDLYLYTCYLPIQIRDTGRMYEKMSIARLDDYWVGQGPTHQILRWKQCQDQPLAGSEIQSRRFALPPRCRVSPHALAISTFPNQIRYPNQKSPTWYVSKCCVPKSHGFHCPCINLNCHKTGVITFPTSDTVDSLNIKVMLILTNPILHSYNILFVYLSTFISHVCSYI